MKKKLLFDLFLTVFVIGLTLLLRDSNENIWLSLSQAFGALSVGQLVPFIINKSLIKSLVVSIDSKVVQTSSELLIKYVATMKPLKGKFEDLQFYSQITFIGCLVLFTISMLEIFKYGIPFSLIFGFISYLCSSIYLLIIYRKWSE